MTHTPKHYVRLSFDAASTTPEANRHWRGADYLSADSELIPSIRHRIVSRARYEAANSGYLQGILSTLADDTVGTGPRMLMVDGGKGIEMRWAEFARSIRLAEKLRIARLAKARDGEVFLRKFSTPKHPLTFDIYEAEQVGSTIDTDIAAYWDTGVPKEVDGILFDEYGEVTEYRFFRIHPGAYDSISLISETYTVPADSVIHYANVTRPGQHRGISEIASSLTVFNDLRRYGDAVLANAETAAQISFLVETDAQPDTETYDYSDQYTDNGKLARPVQFADVLPVAKNSGVFLPEGWKGQQLKAEQPTATYSTFVDAKLNEASRALSMPFNIAKGNSSSYNYSSGMLDHQAYHRKIEMERKRIEGEILDDLFREWTSLDRASHPEDYMLEHHHYWMWDGWDVVNATKESQAQGIRLTNNVTTLADECAAAGKDWEQVLQQRARELDLMRELGLPTTNEQKITVTSESDEEERDDE